MSTTTTLVETATISSAKSGSEGATASEQVSQVTLQGVEYTSVTIDQCEYDDDTRAFYYICPCGDIFQLLLDDVKQGKLDAECPSCSLRIRLVLQPGELDSYN